MGGFFAGFEKARQKEAARRAGSATTTTPAGSRPPPTTTSVSLASTQIQSRTGGTPVVEASKKVLFTSKSVALLVTLIVGLYLTLGNVDRILAVLEAYSEDEENASPPPLPPTMPNEPVEPPVEPPDTSMPLMQFMTGVVLLFVACFMLLSTCVRFTVVWRRMSVATSSTSVGRGLELGATSTFTSAAIE